MQPTGVIGMKIMDKYTVKNKIGNGSFGEIYSGILVTVGRHLHSK